MIKKYKTDFFPFTGSVEANTQKEDEYYPGGILNAPFNKNNNTLYKKVYWSSEYIRHSLKKFIYYTTNSISCQSIFKRKSGICFRKRV